MARSFTTPELQLLQSRNLKARWLTTWYMDDGTHRFCDDVEDLSDGVNTWVGASALASVTDINSSQGFAAESITLTVDGTRLGATGFVDPADFFRGILALNLHQRRVDFELAVMWPSDTTVTLKIPIYAGKINSPKVVYPKVNFNPDDLKQTNPGSLEITIDSLAARYGRTSGRTRSHEDQLLIDPTDLFYQYVVLNDQTHYLYWGKKTPTTGAAAPKYSSYDPGKSTSVPPIGRLPR